MQRSSKSVASGNWRRGVTLTEVLVSMMIMAIGVLMVMSLFPVAALRTLQATQLTNATILRYNVETVIAQDPSLVFDPDRDFEVTGADSDLTEHFQIASNRNYIVDPLGFHVFTEDGITVMQNPALYGHNGSGTPTTLSIPRFDGGLSIQSGSGNTTALRVLAQDFASQPDGWSTDFDTFSTGSESDGTGIIGLKLGNLDAGALANMGSSDNSRALFLGEVPDPQQYRIVVFDTDERFSQAFPLTYLDKEDGIDPEIAAADSDIEASWSEFTIADDFNNNSRIDTRYLPSEFGVAGIHRVLLQSRRTNEFSWMLSVRRRLDGGARGVDVVIKFNSGVDAADERIFDATFVEGTNVIGLRYPYRTLVSDTTTPKMRRGGYVCDVTNARWYRIQRFIQPSSENTGWAFPEYDGVIYTETIIQDPAGEDQFTVDAVGASLLLNGQLDTVSGQEEDRRFPGDGDGAMDFGGAILPTDVIEVYPLGSKEFPDSLR